MRQIELSQPLDKHRYRMWLFKRLHMLDGVMLFLYRFVFFLPSLLGRTHSFYMYINTVVRFLSFFHSFWSYIFIVDRFDVTVSIVDAYTKYNNIYIHVQCKKQTHEEEENSVCYSLRIGTVRTPYIHEVLLTLIHYICCLVVSSSSSPSVLFFLFVEDSKSSIKTFVCQCRWWSIKKINNFVVVVFFFISWMMR